MSDHRKLKVWHRAMDFVTSVYRLTASYPAHELYGLTSQIRRAATSIPLNIAEGLRVVNGAEYQRFLRLAIRSANEVETGLEIAQRLGYSQATITQQHIAEVNQIAAMLQGLHRSLTHVAELTEIYAIAELHVDEETN